MADTTDRPDDGDARDLSGEQPSESGDVDNSSVVVTGGSNTIFVSAQVETSKKEYPPKFSGSNSQREKFYHEHLSRKSRHSEVNYWLSVLCILFGVGSVVAGPVVALVFSESAYLGLSALSVPFAAVWYWLDKHVTRTNDDLNKRVDRTEQKIDEDDTLDKVLRVTDMIGDPQQRDETHRDVARWLTAPKPVSSGPTAQPLPQSQAEPRNAIEPGAPEPGATDGQGQ